jgi:hypothetical protein
MRLWISVVENTTFPRRSKLAVPSPCALIQSLRSDSRASAADGTGSR